MNINKTLAATASCVALSCGSANAGEFYNVFALPTVTVGYAQAVSDRFTMRADIGDSLSRDSVGTKSGIEYDIKPQYGRIGLFGDWFFTSSTFRFTGGLTFNRMQLDFTSRATNGSIVIGGSSYAVSPNDRLEVRIKAPNVTPYLGVGWGHRGQEPGWNLVADIGVSIGRAKIDASVSGALASVPGIQADIDREVAQLREDTNSFRLWPQLSIGFSYRF